VEIGNGRDPGKWLVSGAQGTVVESDLSDLPRPPTGGERSRLAALHSAGSFSCAETKRDDMAASADASDETRVRAERARTAEEFPRLVPNASAVSRRAREPHRWRVGSFPIPIEIESYEHNDEAILCRGLSLLVPPGDASVKAIWDGVAASDELDERRRRQSRELLATILETQSLARAHSYRDAHGVLHFGEPTPGDVSDKELSLAVATLSLLLSHKTISSRGRRGPLSAHAIHQHVFEDFLLFMSEAAILADDDGKPCVDDDGARTYIPGLSVAELTDLFVASPKDWSQPPFSDRDLRSLRYVAPNEESFAKETRPSWVRLRGEVSKRLSLGKKRHSGAKPSGS